MVHTWIICLGDAQWNFIDPSNLNNADYLNQLVDDIGEIVNDYDIDGARLDLYSLTYRKSSIFT
jgi:uncharacterized lipoprotein YddW (UPF0748 family)